MDDHTLRIIVAEDETPAREEILHLLGEEKDVAVVASAGDGIEALRLIRREKPHVVLLDVEMPGMKGVEVARRIMEEQIPTSIIFTTAYEQFAIEAFEVNALDYLLKPVRPEKLNRAVEKVRKRIRSAEERGENSLKEMPARFISVYRGDRIIPLKISSIHFAEAKGRFVSVTTDEGEFETPLSFRDMEERLREPEFFVCHRSFIIRPESVETIDLWVNSSYRLKMRGSDTPVPVSRSKKEDFQKLMGL